MFFSAIETFDDALLGFINIFGLFIPFTSIAVVISCITFLICFENYKFYNSFTIRAFSQSIWVNFVEKIVRLVFDIVDSLLGSKFNFGYYIFFLNIFVIIMFTNLFGLFIGFSVSALLIFTFYLSTIVWTLACFKGFHLFGFDFLHFFLPNVSKALLPFLAFIETASYIIRLFTLSIRLTANITAGHVLLMTLYDFCVKLVLFNWFLFFFVLGLFLFVFFLEMGVAFLQAYVFVTLGVMYLNDSLSFDKSKH